MDAKQNSRTGRLSFGDKTVKDSLFVTTTNGILYVVATPIGNLEDISYRAIKLLNQVAWIAAEDTRHSARLLQHYQIQTPMMSLHEFNEAKRIDLIINTLRNGKSIALISDAGTPLISDPGYRLIEALRTKASDVRIIPVPGACALIAALSASGIPTDRFIFEGFLPSQPHQRQQYLSTQRHETRTLIFYESPHRVQETLEDLKFALGTDRIVVIAKEISKTFEQFFYGSLQKAKEWLVENPKRCKGEFVILVHGATPTKENSELSSETLKTLQILAKALPTKQATALTAKITGARKNLLYEWLTSVNSAKRL